MAAPSLPPWSFSLAARAAASLAVFGLLACGSDVTPLDTDGSTGPVTDEGSTAPDPDGDTGSTSGLPASSDADGTSSEGSEGSSSGEPASFACPPAPFEVQCDAVAQDCPSGLHCLPWSTGESGFDATVCGPLSDAPVERYGTCTQDPESCTDDCEAGTHCQRDDADDLSGTCLGICGDGRGCQASEVCVTCADCVVGTCLASCDPLAPVCPVDSFSCLQLGPGEFACVPGETSGTASGDSCVGIATCSPGQTCVNADAFGDACEDVGCCTAHCDLEDGDPGCTEPEHVCIPFYLPGTAPEGLEHVGLCALPSADPCLVPGACPPPDIDDTYPWCSPSNEGACPEASLGGYGDVEACEGGCFCTASCMDDGDCPMPPTGTAVPSCVEAPLGVGSPDSCMLSCAGGQTCPDGMTCTDFLSGEPLCLWVSPLPPEDC